MFTVYIVRLFCKPVYKVIHLRTCFESKILLFFSLCMCVCVHMCSRVCVCVCVHVHAYVCVCDCDDRMSVVLL